MFVDIVVAKETLLTINTKNIDYLLETQNTTDFPITIDDKEITIRFRTDIVKAQSAAEKRKTERRKRVLTPQHLLPRGIDRRWEMRRATQPGP